MATHVVPPQQTLLIKNVPKTLLARVRDTVLSTTSANGVHATLDKDPACAGKFLLFVNFSSGRDTHKARDTLQAWFHDSWPSTTFRRPTITTKASVDAPYFSIYVAGAPQFTPPARIAGVFAAFGTLHAFAKVCATKDGFGFFVNFADYVGARAALAAACGGRLSVEGCALRANAQRHTLFINVLTSQMRDAGKRAFSFDDAARVGERMQEWAPQPKDVAALLSGIPLFAWDRKSQQYRFVEECTFVEHSVRTAPALPPLRSPPGGPSSELVEAESPTWYATEVVYRTLFDDEDALPSLFDCSKRQQRRSSSPDTTAIHNDDAVSMCMTPPRPSSRSTTALCGGVSVWDVDQVLSLFRRCKFPTEGIVANNIDGPALLSLCADAEAEDMFTAPAPDGLGFNKILFRGRFKSEMAKLSCESPSFEASCV